MGIGRRVRHLCRIAVHAREGGLAPFEAMDVRENLRALGEAGQWEAVLECYHAFGFLNRQQGNRDLARELVETALQAAGELRRWDLEARLLHDLAEIHHQQGRNRIALDLFERSRLSHMGMGARFEALKSKHMSVLVLHALGGGFRKEADMRAREVLDEARELAELHPMLAPWIAHPLEVLSWLAVERGDIAGGRELLEEAIEVHLRSSQDDRLIMLGQCYRRLGQVAMRQGQPRQAESSYLESIDYSQRANNQRLVATTLRHLGDLHTSEREYEVAMEEYSDAMNIAVDGGFAPEQMALSLSFARLYLRLGRVCDALEELQNAVFVWRTSR